jgi:type II secretory pathway pseudopilin PulG
MNRHISNQAGYTYIMVMAAVVVVGIGASAAVELASSIKMQDDERELLFRGMAYQTAIQSYYNSGKTVKTFPRELSDLLQDTRYIHRRHLRRLYSDPIANQDWTLIFGSDGGIQGVASKSKKKPRKTGNFPLGLESFENAEHYSEWIFIYDPANAIRSSEMKY